MTSKYMSDVADELLKISQEKQRAVRRDSIVVTDEIMKNVKFTIAYMNVYLARSSGNEFDNSNVLWVILNFDNVFSQFKGKDNEVEK